MAPIPVQPEQIAPDTWLITELFPAEPGTHIPVRSAVITGAEPIVVDTGTHLNRHAWMDALSSIVDPPDVRWVFLSHDDHDHVGNLMEVLAHAPQATLVTHWFSVERLGGDLRLPLHRMRWVNDGESFQAGGRELIAMRPPIFDAPTARGLFDPRTGFYWGADAFAALVTPGVVEASDLPREMWEDTFTLLNRWISPWAAMLDEAKYAARLHQLRSMGATTVVGAHGPVLRGAQIDRAYELLAQFPSLPDVEFPGQDMLDALLAPMAPAAAA